MKESKSRLFLLSLLLVASISALAYLNLNRATYNTPVLSQPKLDKADKDQVRLPDVHILETATKILRKTLPGG
ncbi:MAG TPA: hypothetical protein VJ953_04130 [Saprospiraceae bacterium]|nr:hypothetical protein [Saprospiraceae bacterium]